MTPTGIAQLRDLRWAILSPDLINHCHYSPDADWYRNFYQQLIPTLNQLQHTPDVVSHELGHCRNLGLYFERLWLMAIRHNPYYELLAHDWQIQGEGRTLGALDFLVKDRESGDIEHWELCVKFYLGTPDATKPQTTMGQWLGLNARDSLDKKYRKLFDWQLPLSDRIEVQEELARRHWGQVSRKRCIFKGRLFYPQDGLLQPPAEVATDHLRGRWQTLAQQQKLPGWQQGDWRLLPRLSWLADHPPASLPPLSGPLDRPGRLCRQLSAGHSDHWALVDDHWPNQHP